MSRWAIADACASWDRQPTELETAFQDYRLMIEPTNKDFAQELRTLKERLSTMAPRSAKQIATAMEALTTQDDAIANPRNAAAPGWFINNYHHD